MKRLVVLFTFFWCLPVQADEVPQIKDFLETEISKVASVPSPLEDDSESLANGYYLKTFKLRIQAEVGFDIEIGNLKVVPGIELAWEKI